MAKPGDVILTTGKEPVSGWRTMGRLAGGTPWYHAEIVDDGFMSHMAGVVDDLQGSIAGKNSVILVRPKGLTAAHRRRLGGAAEALTKEEYGQRKAILSFFSRLCTPGNSPIPASSGNMCSSGPAQVLREIGYDPKLPAPKGYELAGDYLRSPSFKPIAIAGKHYDAARWARTQGLAGRLAAAALVGGAAYTGTKDIVNKEPFAPVAGLVGAGAGGAIGQLLENAIMEKNPSKYLSQLPGGGLAMRSRIAQRAANTAGKYIRNKAPMTVPIAGILAGGLIPYLAAKAIYKHHRKKKGD
jgi:hypothetical protein